MSQASTPPDERARKIHSTVLQALARPGAAAAIAACLGLSEATISRLKSEHLENFARLLAHAGLKVVPVEAVCVSAETYNSIAHIAGRAMARPEVMQQLMFEDDE